MQMDIDWAAMAHALLLTWTPGVPHLILERLGAAVLQIRPPN